MANTERSAARLQALGAAVLFSTGGAGIKVESFSAAQVSLVRSGVAAVALLVWVGGRVRWTPNIVGAGIVYAATLSLFVLANKNTTAANAIFLQSAAPLYLLVLAPLLLKEPVRRADLVAMAAIAVGLALVVSGTQEATAMAPHPRAGNIMAILSGVCLAFTTIGLRWLGGMEDGESRKDAVLVCGNLMSFLIC